MSESEARTLTVHNSPDPKAVKSPRALAELKGLKVAVYGDTKPAKPPKPKRPPKIKWAGTVLAFARKIQADYKAGKIVANSLNAALHQECKRYTRLNGQPLSPHSCRTMLAQATGKTLGKPHQ